MIKGVVGNGSITVDGGVTNMPYFNMNSNNPIIGMMRYNPSNQYFEVFDGTAWIMMPTAYASVHLNPAAEGILLWARKKMDEEARLLALAEKYPTIKDLIGQKADIDSKIAMVEALVRPAMSGDSQGPMTSP